MIWRFLLLALSAFSGFSQAGFYLSMGSTYDQLSHQVKFQGDAANAETGVNQALDFLLGAGFEFQPGERFSMPLGIEMAYAKAKTLASQLIKDQPRSDVFGAIVARPTIRYGWVGAYGLLGYGNVNFTQMSVQGVNSQVGANIRSQFVIPFIGLGAQLKLDRDLIAYAEFISANTRIDDLLGLTNTPYENRPAQMSLQEGRYMLGIRYTL
jgi:opacity protein-like surface antigen